LLMVWSAGASQSTQNVSKHSDGSSCSSCGEVEFTVRVLGLLHSFSQLFRTILRHEVTFVGVVDEFGANTSARDKPASQDPNNWKQDTFDHSLIRYYCLFT